MFNEGLYVPPEGLPCHPIIKIAGTSVLAGAAVWLGRIVVSLNFRDGFLFSAFSLIAIKIAFIINPRIEENFRAPIIRIAIFSSIAIGLPIGITHYLITPLNLTTAAYLATIAVLTRQIFRILTDRNPFL
jgi:hypothetical protein